PCSAGDQCDSGICSGSCSLSGQACNLDSECGTSGGICQGTCVDHCAAKQDCAPSESCAPWPMRVSGTGYESWVNVCLPRLSTGTKANGTACSAHNECSSDWCVDSICTTPCATENDCTGTLLGKKCRLRSFVDGQTQTPTYSLTLCLSGAYKPNFKSVSSSLKLLPSKRTNTFCSFLLVCNITGRVHMA